MGLKRIAKHFKVVHSKHRIGLPEVLHQHIHEFVTHTHTKSISWTFLRNWPKVLSVWSTEGVIRLIYMDVYGDACTMRVLCDLCKSNLYLVYIYIMIVSHLY